MNTNDSGAGSLRAAYESAIANGATADDIVFNIPGAGPHTIVLLSTLPVMNVGNTQVRADTQTGYALGAPVVRLTPTPGPAAQTGGVFRLSGGNCMVRGFHISGFTNAAAVDLEGVGGNVVAANVLVNNGNGIYIGGGTGNLIGGATVLERNTISSNGDFGIWINSGFSVSNRVVGNFLGTSPSGLAAWPNRLSGVHVQGAPGTIIWGGALTPQVISGNAGSGVTLAGTGTVRSVVWGNFIGTDVTGTQALANANNGVGMDGTRGVTVGGTNTDERNIIAGNRGDGVNIQNGSSSNSVTGNYIGLGSNGVIVLSNGYHGVSILDSPGNTIGGGGRGNVIAGNTINGVNIVGPASSGNMVYGNVIGMGVTSNAAPNAGSGVVLSEARANRIGGTGAGEGNTIVHHSGYGIYVSGTNASANLMLANWIGVDAAGNDRGNYVGIRLDNAPSNQIGATTASGRNVISGSSHDGVMILAGSHGTALFGNYIGLDPGGTKVVSNATYGVYVLDADRVTIGFPFATTVVSGSGYAGIEVEGACSNTVIQACYIGTTASGTNAAPNGGAGVELLAARSTVGGTGTQHRNVIAGNRGSGIRIGPGAHDTTVAANYIGLAASGTFAVTNGEHGIRIENAQRARVGGAVPNVISGNRLAGISIEGFSSNAVVAGNYIGTDISSGAPVANNSGIQVASDFVTIGGTNAADLNVISDNGIGGITVSSGRFVRIVGNMIGVGADGASEQPNYIGVWLRDQAAGVTVGGTNAAERNVIARNIGHEVWIEGPSGGHRILGNYIGLDGDGLPYFGLSGGALVRIDQSSSNTIGGTTSSGRNAMGATMEGIEIVGTGSFANVVSGNLIGTDATGTDPGGVYGWAVQIRDASSNRIGGASVADMNVIAHSGGGVLITNTVGTQAAGNWIGVNLIYSNRPGLNIDLGGDGVTENDPLDADNGPNRLQNRPALERGWIVGGLVYVQGVLTSTPSRTFTVSLYRADATNAGSRAFVGQFPVTTDAGGIGTFVSGFSFSLATGAYLCATATDPFNNTSEFGLTRTGAVLQVATDSDGDGMPDYWETLYGLNPAVSNAPTADTDGDQVPDVGEYRADTAPNNAASFLGFVAVSNGAARFVSFPSRSTRQYEIEGLANLAGVQTWTSLIAGVPGTDANLTWADGTTNTIQMFRVKASP